VREREDWGGLLEGLAVKKLLTGVIDTGEYCTCFAGVNDTGE
jgi:hypothetical protein